MRADEFINSDEKLDEILPLIGMAASPVLNLNQLFPETTKPMPTVTEQKIHYYNRVKNLYFLHKQENHKHLKLQK